MKISEIKSFNNKNSIRLNFTEAITLDQSCDRSPDPHSKCELGLAIFFKYNYIQEKNIKYRGFYY